jgi:hypothetical protein
VVGIAYAAGCRNAIGSIARGEQAHAQRTVHDVRS